MRTEFEWIHPRIVKTEIKSHVSGCKGFQFMLDAGEVICPMIDHHQVAVVGWLVAIERMNGKIDLKNLRLVGDTVLSPSPAMRIHIQNQDALTAGPQGLLGGDRQSIDGAKSLPDRSPSMMQSCFSQYLAARRLAGSGNSD